MQHRRFLAPSLAMILLVAACSTDTADDPGAPSGDLATAVADATTTTSPFSTTTTTTTIPPRFVQLLDEPPPFEEVTLLTNDGVELYAKYWPGGPVAVLAGHDFYTASDESNGVPPRSSDSELWWSGVIADAGYTVLSPDYRGHGQSPGDVSIKDSPIDLEAAYDFLKAEGFETIVMLGMIGSGTAAAVLDGGDPDIAFSGIAMIWSAPQVLGLDAQQVLYGIEAPVFLVSFEAPRLERWAKLMSDELENVYDLVIYSPPPTGTSFIDIHGEEFVGRLVDFVDYIAGES